MRGLSQRALGDLMGLGKQKGSSRISRYEHQVTAIGFENLEKLAEVLDVPIAYLLADNADVADAILEVSMARQVSQHDLAFALKGLNSSPEMARALAHVGQLTQDEQKRIAEAVVAIMSNAKTTDATRTKRDVGN